MKICIYTTLLVFFNCPLFLTQNIVPNGDFENYSALPSSTGQYGNCVDWGNANGMGSPDYFHVLGSFAAALPNTPFASVLPFSGQAIMGFAAMGPFGNNYREYPSIQLSSAMEIGSTYNVSLYVTNGESNHSYGYSCNHLGLYFSTEPISQIASSPIGVVPQLEITDQLWSTSWQAVNFNFIADAAYTNLTIGNFYNDAATTFVSQSQAETSEGVYYFIDDVSVERNPVAIIDKPIAVDSLSIYPNPTFGHISITLNKELYGSIFLRNSLGQLVLSEIINGKFHELEFSSPPGIYFLEVHSKGQIYTQIVVNN